MSFSENHPQDNATEPIEVIEIDPQPVSYAENPSSSQPEMTKTVAQIQQWYSGLSPIVKLGVTVGAIFIIFSLLTTVLKLVVTLLSVLILGGVVVILFRYISNSQTSKET
jgi:hypothetical protein